MTKNHLSIFFIVIAFSCTKTVSDSELLTNNKWTITKVEYINTGQIGPEYLNKGTLWNFNRDNTFKLEMKNDAWDRTEIGTWILTEGKLTLFGKTDTTSLNIERLTDKDLIFVTHKEDTLRFTLKSVTMN
jgi:hypothetical protein